MDDPRSVAFTQGANETRRTCKMVDFALLYADEGLRVLPLHFLRPPDCCSCGLPDCRSVAKHPIPRSGVKEATCDKAQIAEWWRLYPDANIGIATGQGLLVVDIDPRSGGSLEALNAVVPLPTTAILRTGGGGLHLYFSYDPTLTIRNSASKLAPGIDIRGENGYVVAPPSIHASGNRYRWDKRGGYIPAPATLLQLLMDKAPTRPAAKETPQGPASLFVTEGKRSSTLVSLAGSLRNQGANEEALLIVLQAMNKGCCQPPLSDAEVRQICKSASNWTPGANGRVSSSDAMIVKNVASLMAEEFVAPPWAVSGLLPEGVSLLAGKPKMGKSWLALSLAISIAQGQAALGGLPTTQGSVLYLGLEDNKQRICSRISQMLQGAPPPDALFWAGACAPLTMGGLADMEAWITSAEQPRLLVIDTLARARAQNGSNSGNVYADDYAAIVPLKQLAEQYHLSILLIHHLRKNGASDPMDEISGSTGLTGATDCNIVLQRERGQTRASLYITGRDVEDQELKLAFDSQTGLWSLSQPPHEEHQMSAIRESILALFVQKQRPLSPTEVASELGLEYEVARKKLSLMKLAGQLCSSKRGVYQLASNTDEIDLPV